MGFLIDSKGYRESGLDNSVQIVDTYTIPGISGTTVTQYPTSVQAESATVVVNYSGTGLTVIIPQGAQAFKVINGPLSSGSNVTISGVGATFNGSATTAVSGTYAITNGNLYASTSDYTIS
jgi:hypothetical protein